MPMPMRSSVDDFFAQLNDIQRPHLEALRELSRDADPEAREELKWNLPVYVRGKNTSLWMLQNFKNHCSLRFPPAFFATQKAAVEAAGYQAGRASSSFATIASCRLSFEGAAAGTGRRVRSDRRRLERPLRPATSRQRRGRGGARPPSGRRGAATRNSDFTRSTRIDTPALANLQQSWRPAMPDVGLSLPDTSSDAV